jgi:hypothetical protein
LTAHLDTKAISVTASKRAHLVWTRRVVYAAHCYIPYIGVMVQRLCFVHKHIDLDHVPTKSCHMAVAVLCPCASGTTTASGTTVTCLCRPGAVVRRLGSQRLVDGTRLGLFAMKHVCCVCCCAAHPEGTREYDAHNLYGTAMARHFHDTYRDVSGKRTFLLTRCDHGTHTHLVARTHRLCR